METKQTYTHIGGQAVMEGVMMRGKTCYVVSVRTPTGEIESDKKSILSPTSRFPFLKWPVVRGVAAFVSSLVVGMKVIYASAEMAGLDDLKEENPSAFDRFLERVFGEKLYDVIMGASVFVAILFSVFLFMLSPMFLTSFLKQYILPYPWLQSLIEGLMRIGIFLVYILLISRMKEIQRLFQYHGAEHKTIACFEHGKELVVENVRQFSRLHKRCGTSFLLIVMVISMVVFFFVPSSVWWVKLGSRIVLVPFIAGISYEVLKWTGRTQARWVNWLIYPGLALQKLTTAEPNDLQIEVAIAAMNGVLQDEGLL